MLVRASKHPYPGPGPRVTVSIGGGQNVVWAPGGSELFYRRLDGQLMAVDMREDGTVGTPTELFEGNYVSAGPGATRLYHIAPDGRFLMMKDAGTATTEDGAIIPRSCWCKTGSRNSSASSPARSQLDPRSRKLWRLRPSRSRPKPLAVPVLSALSRRNAHAAAFAR